MLIKKLLLILTLFLTLIILSSCTPNDAMSDLDTDNDSLIKDTSDKNDTSNSNNIDTSHSSDDLLIDSNYDSERLDSFGNFTALHKTIAANDRIKQMNASKAVYNTGSSYSHEQLRTTRIQANFIATTAGIFFPNASELMEHYLEGEGEVYQLDVDDFLENKIARENMYEDVSAALRAAETMAVKGEKLTIYQIEENIHHNLTDDWKYAVGSYFTSVELYDIRESTMLGVTYFSAKVKYIVQDFYNWDANDTNDISITAISPADLHQLHVNGEAQEFLTYGEEEYEIRWVKGIDASKIEFDD